MVKARCRRAWRQTRRAGSRSSGRPHGRLARCSSAPAPLVGRPNAGLTGPGLRLACAEPGDQLAIFGEALRELTERATYLYEEAGRYWFSTQPTLNRLADDRAKALPDHEVDEAIVKVLREDGAIKAGHSFAQGLYRSRRSHIGRRGDRPVAGHPRSGHPACRQRCGKVVRHRRRDRDADALPVVAAALPQRFIVRGAGRAAARNRPRRDAQSNCLGRDRGRQAPSGSAPSRADAGRDGKGKRQPGGRGEGRAAGVEPCPVPGQGGGRWCRFRSRSPLHRVEGPGGNPNRRLREGGTARRWHREGKARSRRARSPSEAAVAG